MGRMDPVDDRIHLLAERQHGVVARHQVVALGLTWQGWRRRVGGSHWERLSEHVMRRTGAPQTEMQRAVAGVLDAGPHGFLSHVSAAALWGHPAFRIDPVEVITTRERGRRTRASTLAVIHHPRHLPDPFSTVLHGVPVVRPALLLLQLTPRIHPDRLHRILDWFWSRRLLSGPSVAVELAPLLGRGRSGSKVMRELLDALPSDYVPPASNLESRVARILADHGLPRMRRQVDIGGGQWSGRVDFLAADRPLVLEVDSEMYHSALSDVAADTERQRRLEAAGFTVVRVDDHMVWHHPEEVAARVWGGIRGVARRRRAA